MPRRSYRAPKEGKGKLVHIYLPEESLKVARELENLSKFVQIALSEAVGIMTFALLKEKRPEMYYDVNKFEDLIGPYNERYGADPLTKARMKKRAEQEEEEKWRKSSQPKPELW